MWRKDMKTPGLSMKINHLNIKITVKSEVYFSNGQQIPKRRDNVIGPPSSDVFNVEFLNQVLSAKPSCYPTVLNKLGGSSSKQPT